MNLLQVTVRMIMFKSTLKAKLSRNVTHKLVPGSALAKTKAANEGLYRESERGSNPQR